MKKIKGTETDKYEFQKRQYRKSLDLWEEKIEIENHEKEMPVTKLKQWRDLIHVISEYMMEAYSAGIEGGEEPDIISNIEEMYEEFAGTQIGIEIWRSLISLMRDSYEDGRKARG